jgi:hypothetical protein
VFCVVIFSVLSPRTICFIALISCCFNNVFRQNSHEDPEVDDGEDAMHEVVLATEAKAS